MDSPLSLADTVISHDRNFNTKVSEEVPDVSDRSVDLVLTRDSDQQTDPELSVIAQHALSEKEAFLKFDVLMRKW